MEQFRGTTIVCVRRDGQVVVGGDGQVSLGDTIVKGNARKVRKLYHNKIIAGFAGGALAISPISPLATQHEQATQQQAGEPYLQLVQAQPLVRTAPNNRGEMQLSFAPVASRAGPAVVNVYAQRVVRSMARDPFFGRFSAPRVENSLGSGVIVEPEGLIVTNAHVVGPAGTIAKGLQLAQKELLDAAVGDQQLAFDVDTDAIDGVLAALTKAGVASLTVSPPSLERLCASTFERTSFVSPGRRIFDKPRSFFPPSMGTQCPPKMCPFAGFSATALIDSVARSSE